MKEVTLSALLPDKKSEVDKPEPLAQGHRAAAWGNAPDHHTALGLVNRRMSGRPSSLGAMCSLFLDASTASLTAAGETVQDTEMPGARAALQGGAARQLTRHQLRCAHNVRVRASCPGSTGSRALAWQRGQQQSRSEQTLKQDPLRPDLSSDGGKQLETPI